MKPYYEQSGITIYHGDCRVIAPQLGQFDLLLTDPPYGIGADKRQAQRAGKRHGNAKVVRRDYGASDWDGQVPSSWVLSMLMEQANHAIVWGGNYFGLPPARCWLVWDKDNGQNDFADCELAWTNLRKVVRKLTYRWQGMLQAPGVPKEQRQHPTQKPEAVMRWALLQAPQDVQVVLDPFMGSGTTLVAAKRLGKRAVGIEREERFCEIAVNRLAQESLFGGDPVGGSVPNDQGTLQLPE